MPPLSSPPVLAVAALTFATAVAPAVARAQFVTVEVRAGVVRPVGEYVNLGLGQTIGVGLASRFAPTLSVRLDADANTQLDSFDGPGTLDLYTYTLGLETQLAPGRARRYSPLQLTATLSGGASQLRYDSGNEWHPTVGAGLRLTINPTRTLGVFAGASAAATLLGARNDQLGLRTTDAGGTLVAVPIVAGLRITF